MFHDSQGSLKSCNELIEAESLVPKFFWVSSNWCFHRWPVSWGIGNRGYSIDVLQLGVSCARKVTFAARFNAISIKHGLFTLANRRPLLDTESPSDVRNVNPPPPLINGTASEPTCLLYRPSFLVDA